MSGKTSYAKRSVHFIRLNEVQALPLILQLSERKGFTSEMFNEFIQVLGNQLNSKVFQTDRSGRRIFPLKFVEDHSSPNTALFLSITDIKFSYYFQQTHPTQFVLLSEVY